MSSMHRWRMVVCYPIMPLGSPRSLSKGSTLDQMFLVTIWKKCRNFWEGVNTFNAYVKNGGMLPNYATCVGLEAY